VAELKHEVVPALRRGVEIADSTQAEPSGIRGRLLDKVSRIVYRGSGLADRARVPASAMPPPRRRRAHIEACAAAWAGATHGERMGHGPTEVAPR
jgi:hypothetical protein